MPFPPVKHITSPLVPLRIDHIDTDRIIPARYLKAVDSEGFGDKLFHDWRYLPDGTPDPGFILNRPEGKGTILLAGRNFGCGSSREHAVWALYQHGFRAIISSGFADIFLSNALNNGLLPVGLTEEEIDELFELQQAEPERPWTVDLPAQKLLHCGSGALASFKFNINPFRKRCLMEGREPVDYLVAMKGSIEAYEQGRKSIPWITE